MFSPQSSNPSFPPLPPSVTPMIQSVASCDTAPKPQPTSCRQRCPLQPEISFHTRSAHRSRISSGAGRIKDKFMRARNNTVTPQRPGENYEPRITIRLKGFGRPIAMSATRKWNGRLRMIPYKISCKVRNKREWLCLIWICFHSYKSVPCFVFFTNVTFLCVFYLAHTSSQLVPECKYIPQAFWQTVQLMLPSFLTLFC